MHIKVSREEAKEAKGKEAKGKAGLSGVRGSFIESWESMVGPNGLAFKAVDDERQTLLRLLRAFAGQALEVSREVAKEAKGKAGLSGVRGSFIESWVSMVGPDGFTFEAVDDACNSILEMGCVEIDEVRQPKRDQSNIVVCDFLEERSDRLHGFQFDKYKLLHDQIRTKSHIKLVAFIEDRDRLLGLDQQPAFTQFDGEGSFVNGFQETGSHRGVNMKRGVQHHLADLFLSPHISFASFAPSRDTSSVSAFSRAMERLINA